MKARIQESEVDVSLSYASAARFNSIGYSFPKEWVVARKKVKVKVADLTFKSNAKVTRICLKCEAKHVMTLHKANVNPVCHRCVVSTVDFSIAYWVFWNWVNRP